MSLFLVLALQSPEAFAKKKFGGGGSFGKQFKTAPKQPTTTNTQQQKQQGAANQQRSSKKGMMGGLLGGLLAGGLLAALFAGGAFEGLQMADILIIGAIAFAIIWFMRRRRQPQAQAGPFSQQQASAAGGAPFNEQRTSQQDFEPNHSTSGFSQNTASAADDIPFNLPQGFDVDNFLEGARGHYNVLQKAWNENNLSIMKEYLSDEIFHAMQAERLTLDSEPQTQVLFINTELVRADQMFGEACLSVKFTGRYKDLGDNTEENISETWHLERKLNEDNAPWLIVGIHND
ncbi:Tim44 domain-containing protein [Sinobacterium norvegicum]|nr:Tim44-like domain-containing protein [Sinobacterium norvegicum]